MLHKEVTRKERQADGSLLIIPTGQFEPDPCARCGGESKVQSCPGDGRLHHHGRVHTKAGGLQAVCDACHVEVWLEWNPHLTREQYRR